MRHVNAARTRPHRTTATLYSIAAVVFLVTALVSDVAGPAFLVLAMAFVVLALVGARAPRRQG